MIHYIWYDIHKHKWIVWISNNKVHLLSTDSRPEPSPQTIAQLFVHGHPCPKKQIIKGSNVKQKLFPWYSQILNCDQSVIETIPYLYTTTLGNTTEAYSEMLSNANIEVMMWV